MAEGDRLRALHMGEAGHDGARVGKRLFGQRMLEISQPRVDAVDLVAHPELEVGGHLVVARARGVQPARGRPDQFGQPALDVHMDVFEGALELEPALADL